MVGRMERTTLVWVSHFGGEISVFRRGTSSILRTIAGLSVRPAAYQQRNAL